MKCGRRTGHCSSHQPTLPTSSGIGSDRNGVGCYCEPVALMTLGRPHRELDCHPARRRKNCSHCNSNSSSWRIRSAQSRSKTKGYWISSSFTVRHQHNVTPVDRSPMPSIGASSDRGKSAHHSKTETCFDTTSICSDSNWTVTQCFQPAVLVSRSPRSKNYSTVESSAVSRIK